MGGIPGELVVPGLTEVEPGRTEPAPGCTEEPGLPLPGLLGGAGGAGGVVPVPLSPPFLRLFFDVASLSLLTTSDKRVISFQIPAFVVIELNTSLN